MVDGRIKLRHLQCFLAVAQRRSLQQAAASLSITQPAVSKTLRELEEILGVRLFDRGRHGAVPTPDGTVFMAHAGAALSALRRQPGGSEAFKLVDAAMSASVAQPNVRAAWDRAWYKGGSLASGGNGLHVLVHAWLLEDAGRDPYVVVAMANTSTGGIDQFNVQSVLGRILQRLAAAP